MSSKIDDLYIKNRMISHHHALHQIPEIGEDLPETRNYILEVMKDMKCEFTTVITTGVCAFFHKGKDKTIAFRSDMDGLAVEEKTGFSFSSRHEGKMHACGHDGHMSILLAFAEYVNQTDDLPYNILLIFQPAEETLGGARRIVETGIFEKYGVIRTFGLHMWPTVPMGCIATKAGALMPKSSELSVEIKGLSTHAATSYKGVDSLYIATQYIHDITRMQETEIPNGERTLLKICKFQSGTARNVISGHTSLLGTMRAFSLETFDFMERRLKEIAQEYDKKYGCKITVSCTEGYLPVINDKKLYDLIKPKLENMDNFKELPSPVMISEDFSYYGTHSAAVFALLGTGKSIPLHAQNFDFEDETMLAGYKYYVKLAHIV